MNATDANINNNNINNISIANDDNEELISNYVCEDDLDSNQETYLNLSNRNTKSFHNNSNLINEFNTNFRRYETPNYKCDKYFPHITNHDDALNENCSKNFRVSESPYEDTGIISSHKGVNSKKAFEEQQENSSSGQDYNANFNYKITMPPFEEADTKIREKLELKNVNHLDAEKKKNSFGKNNFLNIGEKGK